MPHRSLDQAAEGRGPHEGVFVRASFLQIYNERVYDLLKKTIWSQFREEIAMAGDAEDDDYMSNAYDARETRQPAREEPDDYGVISGPGAPRKKAVAPQAPEPPKAALGCRM